MRGLGMLVLALAGCGFKPAEGVYELVRSDTESTGDYSVCGYWDGFIYDGLGEIGVQLDPLAIVSEELGSFSACTMEDDASFSCLYTEDLDYTRTLDGAWESASTFSADWQFDYSADDGACDYTQRWTATLQ